MVNLNNVAFPCWNPYPWLYCTCMYTYGNVQICSQDYGLIRGSISATGERLRYKQDHSCLLAMFPGLPNLNQCIYISAYFFKFYEKGISGYTTQYNTDRGASHQSASVVTVSSNPARARAIFICEDRNKSTKIVRFQELYPIFFHHNAGI